ncbi:hypothetical protein CO046_03205 [Candidatus Peregrinibacteria bacterium CG_4_9_14_0_2_um_filter_53_11]|nr:MAG: hypothetical protein CO046_03205 [Candidatus Peregrinibacteria bacterium CG_4_9_14_0_2_um_filter_53_11]
MSLIHVQNLTKQFVQYKRKAGIWGSIRGLFHRESSLVEAVKEISFDIKKGEFVGFVGPNGAGKTTTLKMLSGILTPTTGEATVMGFTPWKRADEFKRRFALVMGQKNQLWWDLPVVESLEFNRVMYDIPKTTYTSQKDTLVKLLNIEHVLETQVRKLSLGERMKCELAAALLHRPEVLFLDEPTIGLDVVSQQNIREFLRSYNKEEGATIILTSHYMEDIRRLCERVIIISTGMILYDGDYQRLVEHFADSKLIEMSFREEVSRSEVERFGELVEYSKTLCKLAVPRNEVREKTAQLLEHLPIEDISIREESMEDIVSDIFQGKKLAPHDNPPRQIP